MASDEQQTCRACLVESKFYKSIFDVNFYDGSEVTISSMIKMCTNVQMLDNDHFPKNICRTCAAEIDTAYKFRLKCIKADNTLRGNLIFIKEEPDFKPTSPCPLICEVECAKFEFGEEEYDVDETDTIDRLDVKAETPITQPIPKHDITSDESDDEVLIKKVNKLKTETSKTIDEEEPSTSTDTAPKKNNKTEKIKTKKKKSDTKSNTSDDDGGDDSYFENDDYNGNFDDSTEESDSASDITIPNKRKKYPRHSRSRKNRLQCNICPKTFFKQKTLDLHLERHNKPGFKCNICENEFMTGGGLKEHVIRNHLKEPGTELNLKDHPFKCKLCVTEYLDLEVYITHMKATHRDEQDPLKPCPECGKQLRKHNYDKHLKIHFGERKFKCTNCDMTFLFANNLKKHMYTHTGERNFPCPKCEVKFKSKGNLTRHLASHDKPRGKHRRKINLDRPLECSVCDFKINSRSGMIIHMRKHRHNKPQYKCRFCSIVFTHKASFKLHFFDHPDEERTILEQEQAEKDKKHRELLREKAQHSEEYIICDICGKNIHKRNIEKHRQAHSEPQPYSCEECGKKFTNLHNLKVHVKAHKGVVPFVCEMCGKGFGHRKQYDDHLFTHSGYRPYKCDLCGYTFIYKSCLESHLAAHARGTAMRPKTAEDLEKRVKCLLCDALFSTKGNMDKHIRKIHQVIGYIPSNPSTAFGPTVEEVQNKKESNDPNDVEDKQDSAISDNPVSSTIS